MADTLKILHVAAEMTPLLSTGGLAEVVNALPKAQRLQGHDVRVAMPCYKGIPAENRGEQVAACTARMGGNTVHGALRRATAPETGLPLYLVEHEGFFGREQPYGHEFGEYGDNAERFCFFCLALLDSLPATGWIPDVVNCHDWQTGALPMAIKTTFANHPGWGGTPVIYTIHNLNYQGRFGADQFPYTGLEPSLYSSDCLEYFGDINLMKGAITKADKLNTVSPRYAQEVQTAEYGAGLDGVLRGRAQDLQGILNGIDYDVWSPAVDQRLPAQFDKDDLAGKRVCKSDLQAVFGLPGEDVPLFGVVSRLTWQKGIDLLVDALEYLKEEPFQLVLLGTGEQWLENRILTASQHYPDKIRVILRYDSTTAHKIVAGADFFLMPSRYEPCGLSQMYSLAYGTIPIVRRTGGLADSVKDISRVNERNGDANGLVFTPSTPQALARSMRRALQLYATPAHLHRLRMCGMQEDFSWNRTCVDYLNLYRQALGTA
ncbi:MAG: glycogen synthase GlgA [Candidatus Hydrogenedentota bacterium]